MGKSAKAKKRRYKYSKQEFSALCCDKCTLCIPGTEPSFCYGKMYIKDPKIFISKVFKELLGFKRTLYNENYVMTYESDPMLRILFQETFCDSRICVNHRGGSECYETEQCLFEFIKQLKGVGAAITVNNKCSKHKKNKRQVYEPYATFFCNAKFEQTVKEILNNTNEGANDGDVDIEQSKTEECTCEHNRDIDQSADDSESEVSGSTELRKEHIQSAAVYL